MLRRSRCLVASLLFAGLVGLVRGQDAGPPTPYFPLAVGTTWSYRAGDSRFQLKVAGIEKVGDTSCARIELIVNGKAVSHEHVAATKTGLFRYSFEGKEARPAIEFLKLPPKAGDTWKVDSKVDGQPLKGTFKAGEEETKVPAGAYKAITVTGTDLEANGVKVTLKYFFAEKVGMVRQQVDVAGQKVNIELEKFEAGSEKK
ncbi:MAG: hypothetical protein U0736_25520 [Gemmataceae bacterium]